jgi:hypothetical protein
MSNIFEDNYLKYLNAGYSCIPDGYMKKSPLIKGWTTYCDRLPTFDECKSWADSFQASNIAICMGKASGIVGLDLDTIRPDILKILEPILPTSPVQKKGAKGWTRFFRFNNEANSMVKFDGEVVIEILSTGKKTTIPPSIHPNGSPYKWFEQSLLDIDVATLPSLPPMILSHIEAVLKLELGESITSNAKGKIESSGRNAELGSLCAKLIANKTSVDLAIIELTGNDLANNKVKYFTDINEFPHTCAFTNALTFYNSHLNSINGKHYRSNTQYETPLLPSVVDAKIEELTPLTDTKTGKKKKVKQRICNNCGGCV